MASNQRFAAPAPVGIFSRVKGGLTVYRGTDGRRYLFIVTSNSYKDREDETITTKALNHYVNSAWAVEDKCLPRNPLRFWHDEGAEIGDIVWCAMEGPFLLEVARERKDKALRIRLEDGKTWTTTVKAIWDAIEKVKVRWGASHGFEHPESARTDDGVYKYIRKFETSVLPLDAAANPFTFAGVFDMDAKDKFLDQLVKIPGFAQKFRKGIRSVEQELSRQGLEHKALTKDKGLVENALSVLDAAFTKIGGTIPEGFASTVLQQLIAVSDEGAVPVEPVATEEPVVDEYMADEAMPADDVPVETEDEEEKAAMYAKQLKLLDRLVKSQETITTDNSTVTTAITAMAKSLEPLAALPAALKSLEDRIGKIERRFGGAPRRASASEETALPEDKDLLDTVKSHNQQLEELIPGSGIHMKPASANGSK